MKFQFLDRERELKYTFRDILNLREKYADKPFTMDDVPDLIARGLKHEDPSITAETAADIVDMSTIEELCTVINKASGLGKPTDGDAARPTAESSGSSGPSPDTTSGSPTMNSGS